MQIHLFKKVYLSFDFTFRPVFNTLIVSQNHYAPHPSFFNQHVGMGIHYGKHDSHDTVAWKDFFVNVKDSRTVVYADPKNFTAIYLRFLKTVKPYIKKSAAIKILKIILKSFESYYYSSNLGDSVAKDSGLQKILATSKECLDVVDQVWSQSKPFDLDPHFVQNNIGIEFLLAQYWADGRNESLIKQKLQDIWWKVFVYWCEEFKRLYPLRWYYAHPDSSHDAMLASCMNDPTLQWMVDPALPLVNVEQFKQNKNWADLQKIYTRLCEHDGLIINYTQHWQNIVDLNWDAILNKTDPLTILVGVATEPTHRHIINGWLISYFAAQSERTLKEMVS